MDDLTVQKFLDKHTPRLIEFLGIADYNISFDLKQMADFNPETFPPADERTPERTAGSCLSDPVYRQATITFDPSAIEDAEVLLDVLFHELLHVVLADYDLYREAVRSALLDPRAFYILDNIWSTACEHALIRLENIFNASLRLDLLTIAKIDDAAEEDIGEHLHDES